MLFFCVFYGCLIQHCMSFWAFFLSHEDFSLRVTLHVFTLDWRLTLVQVECGMTCRRTPDPLEELNWMYWISDRSISIIYRQDMWGSSELFLHSSEKIQNCISLSHRLPPLTPWSSFDFLSQCCILHSCCLCLSLFSPGRSPSCYDNEIVMMNHVYKERFPKVSLIQTQSQM